MSYVKIFIAFILLSIGQLAWTQEEDILPVSDVEVVKAFEAKLEEAKKISASPVLPDTNLDAPNYNYNITIVPLDITYPDPRIRPLALKGSDLKDPKMFWLKAGYGNLKKPNINFGYNLFVEDLYNATLWADYHGGDEIRAYDNLKINALGSFKLMDALEIIGGVDFQQDRRDLNFPDTTSSDGELLQRKLNSITFKGGIKNNEQILDRLEFGLTVEFQRNSFNYKNEKEAESVFIIPAYANIHLGENSLFSFSNKFESSSSDLYSNAGVNQLKGQFSSTRGQLSFHLGASYLKSKNHSNIFPIGKLTYALPESPIRIYLGADQDYKRNNLISTFVTNPYFSENSVTNNLSITNELFIGSDGSIMENKLKYRINSGYKLLTNQIDFRHLILNRDVLEAKFTDGNALFIEGFIDYKLNNWLDLGFNAQNHFYNLDEDFGLPTTEVALSLKLHSKNKWQVSPIFSYRSKAKVEAVDLNGLFVIKDLNQLVDLSIECDYFFTPNFGIYTEVNNIFNQRYERWNTYQDFKFNVFGGIKIKF